ncbi:hypothetical protein [Methanoplanus limicola]|uniref:Uncharacterized protein n=1 Tax=Methanoplanus limicola DSM 2279 TaxID=937775 RepID=H1Z2E4_9EURY|nr:hypothetical protein [Methanoplanus limicola]EHQ35470.1 hypothetical protein Metlim_1361 [Methanoplanus limicola DSM 2279]
MDIIEEGFDCIVSKLKEAKKDESELSGKIKENEVLLLARMGEKAASLVENYGLNMLLRAKNDGKGELYDTIYYDNKMFILAKSDPLPFRPDNSSMPVSDQFCVLDSEGKFFEIYYSAHEYMTDSYAEEMTPERAFEIYGYEIIFMLYKAFQQYLKEEQDLVHSLEKTVAFVFKKDSEDNKA